MRMKQPVIFLALSALIAGCRTDEPVTPAPSAPTNAVLRVHVIPEWDGQPFQAFTEYRAPGDIRFQAEMLRFYLSDILSLIHISETTRPY